MHTMMVNGNIIALHKNYVITENCIFKHNGNIRFEDIENMLEIANPADEELIAPEDAELVL